MIEETYRIYTIHRITSGSVRAESGCLEYGTKSGYCPISITINKKRKLIAAHRVMYMAINNCFDLNKSIFIKRTCGNGCCVEPKHLLVGEKKYKKHTRILKFTEDQIREIRNAEGKIKHIAEIYGASLGYVSKIKNMKAKTLI